MWRDPPSLKKRRRPDGPGAEGWELVARRQMAPRNACGPTPTMRPPSVSSACRGSVRNPSVAEIVEPVG